MCSTCLPVHTERNARIYADKRRRCIEAYGKRCVCCGLSKDKYLQLDHVNNDGAQHRRELTGGGRKGSIYVWAVRNGFPPSLQLLCANCHQAKTLHGGCTPDDHVYWMRGYDNVDVPDRPRGGGVPVKNESTA